MLVEMMVIAIAKLTHHIHKWTGRPGGGGGGGRGFMVSDKPGQRGGAGSENP